MHTSVSLALVLVAFTSAQVHIRYAIDEEVRIESVVGNLKRDSGVLDRYSPEVVALLRFGMLSLEYQSLFAIDEVSGAVYVQGRLDRDQLCPQSARVCVVAVEAAIVQPTEYFAVLHVDITVRDINDNSPTFTPSDYTLKISENSVVGSQYMLPMATDLDSGLYGVQSYQLKEANPLFSLVEGSGSSGLSLVLEGLLDRESQAVYLLEVVAKDRGIPPRTGILNVHIKVIDANDNSPVFNRDLYEVTIPEDYDLHASIIQVTATDLDEGENGRLVYTLSPQSAVQYGDIFAINNETGVIFLTRRLDYRMGTHHRLIVLAYDLGSNPLQAHATVVIHVQDINNHRPEISVYPVMIGQQIGVKENATPGEIIALITVKDDDPGENGICSCQSLDTNFRLEKMYENGFKVVSGRMFDRELKDSYQLVIRCQDSGSPALSSVEQITVRIFDENDNSPVFDRARYEVSVKEDAPLGSTVIRIHASDTDEGEAANITYSLDGEAVHHLSIDPASGLVTLRDEFDYEKATFHSYSVIARDNGTPPKESRTELRIEIIDVNDEPPVFIQNAYNFGTYENQPSVVEVGTVTAVDRDSDPYNRFAYSLYGERSAFDVFSIDSRSGRISTRVSLDREHHDVYHLIAMATDIEPPYLSGSVSVTIYVADKNDNPPMIVFPNRANNSVEVSAYSPLDFIFSRVVAHDLDLGKNAKLEYSLADDHGLFSIDPMQGYLYVKSNLHNMEESAINLQIMVTDEGSPPLATNATLQVVINKTVMFAKESALLVNTDDSLRLDLSEHEKILIALGAVTSLIVAILIAAIVFVKRRQARSHSKEEFHCSERVNYTQKLASLPACQDVSAEESKAVHRGDYAESGNTLQQKTAIIPDVKRDKLNQCSPPPAGQADTDIETASRYSAELSNTDSGHGPSEEGDMMERIPPNDNIKHQQRHVHNTETGPTRNKTWNIRNVPHLYQNSPSNKFYPSLVSHEQSIRRHSTGAGKNGTAANEPNNASFSPDGAQARNITKRDNRPCYAGGRWHGNCAISATSGEHRPPLSHQEVWPSTDGDESIGDSSSASSGSFIIAPLHQLKSIDV